MIHPAVADTGFFMRHLCLPIAVLKPCMQPNEVTHLEPEEVREPTERTNLYCSNQSPDPDPSILHLLELRRARARPPSCVWRSTRPSQTPEQFSPRAAGERPRGTSFQNGIVKKVCLPCVALL